MTPKGQALPGVHTESYWYKDLPSRRDATAAELVEKALKRLGRRVDFLKEVVLSGGRWEFYVTGGGDKIAEEFSTRVLGLLANARGDLSLEVIRQLPRQSARHPSRRT